MNTKIKNYISVATCQINSSICLPEKNLKKAEKIIISAKYKGAELVVLPELHDVGYDLHKLKTYNYTTAKTLQFYSELGQKQNIYIVAGIFEKTNTVNYNSLYVFSPEGKIVTKYRKNKLFPLSIEDELFNSGKESSTFSIGNFKIGLSICFDIRFPEIYRSYLQNGCNTIIVSSAFPFPRLDHWRILTQSRAIENQSYLISSNRVGKDGDFWFCGNSSIIDPWGNTKAKLNETEEGFTLHELNTDKVLLTRKTIPCSI